MTSTNITKISSCRICGNKKLLPAISLGNTPLANSFLSMREIKKKEAFFPLKTVLCTSCGLLQLSHVVNPKVLFSKYLYESSTSKTFIEHFERFAKDTVSTFHFKKYDFVVDIGSNDGILLQPLKKMGLRVLGVDPAKNIALIARRNGIKTLTVFFNEKAANKIKKEDGLANVITATNVFAHVNNLYEFLSSVCILLAPNGVFIAEFPYLLDMLEKNSFDLIYHEHLSYFSLYPLIELFKRNDMYIFDVHRTESHGGSIRIFAAKLNAKYKIHNSVHTMLLDETKRKLQNIATYKKFETKINGNKIKLRLLLQKLKKQKKKIIGFGAPAKGNTLLNFFKIDKRYLDYIVDDSKLKQSLFTPGTHMPIFPTNKISSDKIDYIFLLAWNFADSIMARYSDFLEKGGKFILPIPTPKIQQ